jgi:hypothetical protein
MSEKEERRFFKIQDKKTQTHILENFLYPLNNIIEKLLLTK